MAPPEESYDDQPTDQPTDQFDADLTPEQAREVTRLLADARHDEPMPADVVDRLDRVLADLDRGGSSAPVVSLDARRRRRVLVGLVAAAAVLTVVGVGARTLSAGGSASSSVSADTPARAVSSDSGAAASSPEATAAGPASPRTRQPSRPGAGGVTTVPTAEAPSDATRVSPGTVQGQAETAVPHLRSTTFETDVESLLRDSDYGLPPTGDAAGSDDATLRLLPACEPADFGTGALIAVTYDGTPAVLAFRPPVGQSQVVDLLQCGTAAVVRSITLPR